MRARYTFDGRGAEMSVRVAQGVRFRTPTTLGIEGLAMTLVNDTTLVNMKHRYVATTVCPIGTPDQVECAALADGIFENDEAACAALVAHLVTAQCHTREQLAHVVGDTQGRTYSYRLVHELRGAASSLTSRSPVRIGVGAPVFTPPALRLAS